ncbi:MAG: hypothetical protein A3E85_06195 [Gammaproteobacteria bacterium RIFCSPHIGHO2_12_FULL_45_12]|nr:MAG: hypothetical protein A3E85_06195 [Gammaproteobacteria bacterium RIFCSPHIGHO2_12_FULL_45_12]
MWETLLKVFGFFRGEASEVELHKLGGNHEAPGSREELMGGNALGNAGVNIENFQNGLDVDEEVIANFMTQLKQLLSRWLEMKSTLPLNAEGNESLVSDDKQSTSSPMQKAMKGILRLLKADVSPIEWELSALLLGTKTHVEQVHGDLRALYDELKREPAPDKKVIWRRMICDYNISVVNDMMMMMQSVMDEIEFAKKRLKLTIDVIDRVFNLLFLMITKVPLPAFSAGIQGEVPNFIAGNIAEVMSEIEAFISAFQADCQKGLQVVSEGGEPQDVPPAPPSSPAMIEKDPEGRVKSTSLPSIHSLVKHFSILNAPELPEASGSPVLKNRKQSLG